MFRNFILLKLFKNLKLSIMETLSKNGISTLNKEGEENYTTFYPSHRPMELFYQYDYRHSNGKLFSCVARTLKQCRDKKDKWIVRNNLSE